MAKAWAKPLYCGSRAWVAEATIRRPSGRAVDAPFVGAGDVAGEKGPLLVEDVSEGVHGTPGIPRGEALSQPMLWRGEPFGWPRGPTDGGQSHMPGERCHSTRWVTPLRRAICYPSEP